MLLDPHSQQDLDNINLFIEKERIKIKRLPPK
jgi:hypothetical protein